MTTDQQHTTQVRLPDGREVACDHAEEVPALWDEIVRNSPFPAAVDAIRPGDTIIDVGAHIGLVSMFLADRLPDTRILAFEPASRTHACLLRNFAAHVPNGIASATALSDRTGNQEFHYYPDNPSMSTLYVDHDDDAHNLGTYLTNLGVPEIKPAEVRAVTEKRAALSDTVGTSTLTTVIEEQGVTDIGLLKIDVERAELTVLDGMRADLWPRVRQVVVEVHDLDGRLGVVVARLATLGYEVRVSQAPAFRGASVYLLFAGR
ncbi:FkbM family methyltransferase [Amycolatopsis sp. NPDC005232]|uniref:FkbM family methyltransferase n=1 Tax=Amycolatopsis sp. NPDC005232 TaxID=3157027 RepID=UPI0033B6BBED